MTKSSSISKNNSEAELKDSILLFPFSRTKSLSFSLMLPSSNSKPKSKPTNSQLKLVSELFPQSTTQSQLDQQVSIPHKSTSSMLSTSPPRSTKVKSKSPKISKSVPRVRKSKLQKLLSSRNSTSSLSPMV